MDRIQQREEQERQQFEQKQNGFANHRKASELSVNTKWRQVNANEFLPKARVSSVCRAQGVKPTTRPAIEIN